MTKDGPPPKPLQQQELLSLTIIDRSPFGLLDLSLLNHSLLITGVGSRSLNVADPHISNLIVLPELLNWSSRMSEIYPKG